MFDLIPIWKRLRRSSKRRATVGKPPRPRLALEALDERIMLSITSTFSAATGVLTVAGDDLANTIVVSRDAAGTILVNNGAVVIQGGQATIANTSRILVTGGAGNDALTLDETNGGLPQASLDGGAGNDVLTGGAVAVAPGFFDTLLGGAGDDTINGGAGAEFINGGTGNDTLFGGAGDDRFSWNPGDGNDAVDGQAGNDLLGVFGSNLNENIAISANGTRALITRDVDGMTMDLNSLEVLDVIPLGGADTVTVNDLTGAGVGGVNIALGADAFHDGDGAADTVILNGTNLNDNIAIVGSAFGSPSLNVVGLSAQVNITDSEPTDRLAVNTLGGFDRVNTTFLDAGVIGLTVDLGDGQTAGVTTTTTLRTSTTTAVVGQTEVLTATVTAQAGVPTGTVLFMDGTTQLGFAQVDVNGQATLPVSLGVGDHALTASFVSNAFPGSASAAVDVSVDRAGATVSLASSLNPAATGQAVTFTATVAAVAQGAATPTGTVTFKAGNTIVGTVAVGAGGKVTFTTTFAAAGSYAVTAVYNGDANFAGTTQMLTEQVNAPSTRRATTTTLAASGHSVFVGRQVTFTATVRDPAGSGTPTGTVTFFLGNVAVATIRLDATGKATLKGFFSRAGQFTIKAVYNGDTNFASSSSQSLTEQVS
jgi:hypothetical protein